MDASFGPRCAVCSHYHEPGVACTICGHKGLSTKHRKFKAACTSSEAASSTLHAFVYETCAAERRNPLHSLARIIRRRVFVEELKQAALPAGMDAAVDATARHVVAMVGHAAQGCTRWRVLTAPFVACAAAAAAGVRGPSAPPGAFLAHISPGIAALDALGMAPGTRVAYIDRLCVLPRHRRMGVASHVLGKLVEDIAAFGGAAAAGDPPIAAIVAPCEENAALAALFGGLGFRPHGSAFASRAASTVARGVAPTPSRLLVLQRA
jgi:ribosomal protein S18 acetylase RimI-like enzyme